MTAAGCPLNLRNFRRNVFDPAVRAAGLDGLTPHDLRHTAASLAVSSGANVRAVQRMLGHKSAAMTLDVYSGLFDDDLDALAERMDQRLLILLRTLCGLDQLSSVLTASQ
jgi:integrase